MAGYDIDGRDYPVPSVFELTMGEAQVLYDYCGYVLEDFVPPLPDEDDSDRIKRFRDPAFKRAMVHIAYQRGNLETTRDEVAALVDNLQMVDMVIAMYAGDEDENPTPVSQNEPPNRNGTDERTNSRDSGRHSPPNSAPQDVTPSPIGTTG